MNRKEFYNTLSEDVKAKIKTCKTEEEMMQVLAEDKIELDPELLDSVSGGNVHKPNGGHWCPCEGYSCPSDDGC